MISIDSFDDFTDGAYETMVAGANDCLEAFGLEERVWCKDIDFKAGSLAYAEIAGFFTNARY